MYFVRDYRRLVRNGEKDGIAYLEEAKRAAKRGGKIIVSYLDLHGLPFATLARLWCCFGWEPVGSDKTCVTL